MGKKANKRMALKDKELPAHQATSVKGGLIGLGNVGLSSGPQILTSDGLGPTYVPFSKLLEEEGIYYFRK